MLEIISLFTCFRPLLSATTSAQFARVGCALIAMTSRVTMLGISRWAGQCLGSEAGLNIKVKPISA